jgi:hypothetical protein
VDVTKSTKHIGTPSPSPDDGSMEALPRPVCTSTITNADADDKISKSTAAGPSTAAGLSPVVGLKTFTTANALDNDVSKVAVPVAKNTIHPDNLCESTGQLGVTRPERKGNLKYDEDYETGEKGYHLAVFAVKNENSFGIYAYVRKFKEEIEGFPAIFYELCNSYARAHKYLEEYLHQEKGNRQTEMTAVALAALKIIMSSVMRI